ncbi:carbohydrate kinase family protein [Brachybacterium sp. J144]|uniref:carbohydrate kinase family protein n=1 Tax=Brachybacterium sp. J144 TaxID=3116487 RepID=UPI003FA5F025
MRICAITCGRSGSALGARGARHHVDALPVEVVDTVGAGDTYMAAMINDLLGRGLDERVEGRSLDRIGRAAAIATSITVQRRGADMPTSADVVAC